MELSLKDILLMSLKRVRSDILGKKALNSLIEMSDYIALAL